MVPLPWIYVGGLDDPRTIPTYNAWFAVHIPIRLADPMGSDVGGRRHRGRGNKGHSHILVQGPPPHVPQGPPPGPPSHIPQE